MKNMSTHMMVCVGLIALGVVLAIAGVTGTWLALPFIGCMLMMGMMVWMMMGMGHGGGDHR